MLPTKGNIFKNFTSAKTFFMFLRNIFYEKLPLFRISRPAFALFLSRVHTYNPSSHDEIRLRICDPIGNIYY